jgi:hypothetical protein
MKRKEPFLREEKGSRSERHKEYLGMEVPEGYFSTSKQSILDLVKEEDSSKNETKIFYLRRSFQIAATIALLISVTVWIQFSQSEELEIASNDVLIESLFVDEENLESFTEEILVSEVVEEAGKEQELENVLMNSLFVEDSLIDNYTEKSIVDHIIL